MFGNESIDVAIKSYLNSQNEPNKLEYNSFLVTIIRILFVIYGKLDIINPYKNNNISIFDNNLKKYGLSDEALNEFKDNMLKYYQIEKINETSEIKQVNEYYLKIQKNLIDMLVLKKDKALLTNEEQKDFEDLLFSSNADDPYKIAYNFLHSSDHNYVDEYYKYKMFEEDRTVIEEERLYLDPTSYYILKYNIESVKNSPTAELNRINDEVFNYFKVDKNDSDKINKLDIAIRNYLKYNNRITSGNGFVDGLLLLAIISTCVMVYFVVKIFI